MHDSSNTLRIHQPTLQGKTLTCTYTYNDIHYTNTYTFPFDNKNRTPQLKKMCEWVAVSGCFGLFNVAYHEHIAVDFALSDTEKRFFEKIIFLGLGEFRVTNNLPLNTRTSLRAEQAQTPHPVELQQPDKEKPLLLNGGGKDGSVSALLLTRLGMTFDWFQRGSSQAQINVANTWDSSVIQVDRILDEKRLDGPYEGHKPMSASIAFIASLCALLTGHTSVIASNEASANEANFVQDGVSVNHQYSKSLEFESDIQNLLADFNIPIKYFSLLRPLHELQIACIASKLAPSQLHAITSCNNGTKNATWCMHCAKCAFVALVMTASSPQAVENIWGYQPINTSGLHPYFIELLDPTVQKPFECVGTLAECQLAAALILNRKDVKLNDDTGKLLRKYASSDRDPLSNPLLTTLSEDLIPEYYKPVITLITEQIDSWKRETYKTY